MRNMLKKYCLKISQLFRSHPEGSGGVYVVLILGLVSGLSFLLTGGLVPQIEKRPVDPEYVDILVDLTPVPQQNLQMRNIQAVPSPTGSGVPQITPTPGGRTACLDNAAVSILVDVSGSMATNDPGTANSRLNRLKVALNEFIRFFNPNTAVSLISFSGTGNVLVPFGKLSSNQTALTNAIASLQASGSTNMKNGLADAENQLNVARTSFPGYDEYVVFMTDGVPESGDCAYRKPTGVYRYYSNQEQAIICTIEGTNTEPTLFTHKWSPVEPANEIKQSGAKIFSILFEEPALDAADQDRNAKATSLMKSVASDPDSTYFLSNPTTKNIGETYAEIAQKICPGA